MDPSGRCQYSSLVRWVGLMNADHGSLPKSRLAAVTLAQKLHSLNRAASVLNITSQWQDTEIFIFYFKSNYKK